MAKYGQQESKVISKSEIKAKYTRLLELEEDIREGHSDYQEFLEAILNIGPGPCHIDFNQAKREYGDLISEIIADLSHEGFQSVPEVINFLADIIDSRDHFIEQIEEMNQLPDPDCIIYDMQPTESFEVQALPAAYHAFNSDKINWPFDFSTAIARNLKASLFSNEGVDTDHEFELMPPSFVRAVVSHVREGETQENPTNDKLNTRTITLQVVITCENTTQTTTTKTTALTTSPTCASPDKASSAQNAESLTGQKSVQSSASSTTS